MENATQTPNWSELVTVLTEHYEPELLSYYLSEGLRGFVCHALATNQDADRSINVYEAMLSLRDAISSMSKKQSQTLSLPEHGDS
jgi:hypothetical protein